MPSLTSGGILTEAKGGNVTFPQRQSSVHRSLSAEALSSCSSPSFKWGMGMERENGCNGTKVPLFIMWVLGFFLFLFLKKQMNRNKTIGAYCL